MLGAAPGCVVESSCAWPLERALHATVTRVIAVATAAVRNRIALTAVGRPGRRDRFPASTDRLCSVINSCDVPGVAEVIDGATADETGRPNCLLGAARPSADECRTPPSDIFSVGSAAFAARSGHHDAVLRRAPPPGDRRPVPGHA